MKLRARRKSLPLAEPSEFVLQDLGDLYRPEAFTTIVRISPTEEHYSFVRKIDGEDKLMRDRRREKADMAMIKKLGFLLRSLEAFVDGRWERIG